ncbi:MAG: LysM peptidoglycan-binding domain-containing protein [Planctomycetes bacterium]|nr:LysM peptidoglycan-binding domain-containing protein [Planctomycetota bacterium]
MRTIGSIERFLVVGIVLVIGAILMVAIKGAGDFERRQEALIGAGGKPEDGKIVAAKGAGKPTEPRAPRKNDPKSDPKKDPKLDPKGDGTGSKAPAVEPAPVQPPLRRETPLSEIAGGSNPGAVPGPAPLPAGGSSVAPPDVTPGNPLIEDLLDRQREAALLVGDPRREDDTAAPPVVIAEDDSIGGAVGAGKTGETAPEVAPVGDAPRDYTYEVRSGDSLERIARAVYGDGGEWKAILAANPALTDKNTIRVGMQLKLPKAPTQGQELVKASAPVAAAGSASDRAAGNGSAAGTPDGSAKRGAAKTEPVVATPPAATSSGFKRVTSSSEHTVARGDTLMSIALANYGTKAAWKLVFEANSDRIADKDRLKLGTVLRLPAN